MFNIALNTFREIIRNKLLSLLVLLGIVFVGVSLVIDTLSLGESRRVLYDFGLSFIEITGLIVILFLGGSMIAREIEGRTIYLMLSKPIKRGAIVLGKFLGFSWVIGVIVLVETVVLLLILSLSGIDIDPLFFTAILAIWIKLEIMLALILFFSTWVSPVLAMFMTMISYIIGHSGYAVLDYAFFHGNMTANVFGRVLLATFPNLEALNIKNYIATDAVISTNIIGLAVLLGIIYLFCILYFSVYIFERKSFDTV